MTDDTNEVPTEPTLERRTRRQFSSSEKQRLLAEYDAISHGEKGAWLRRQGLYGSQLANWRKTFNERGSRGLEPQSGGRRGKDARDKRIEELEREKHQLQRRVQVAEGLVDLQKKCLSLIEDAHSDSSQ